MPILPHFFSSRRVAPRSVKWSEKSALQKGILEKPWRKFGIPIDTFAIFVASFDASLIVA
jgi:hypothetical protein